jgi:hypothetical protein
MKRTIAIRGEKYSVQSLEGDLNLLPVLAYVKAEDLDNAEQKRKAAIAVKELCPKIPDSLINNDGKINLFIREWQELIWDIRELYFTDNLALAVKTGQFKEEIRFAKGYAQFKAMRQEYLEQIALLDEDEDLTDLPDTETSQELIDKYHFEYYQQEIDTAKELGQSDRAEKLTGRLQRLKDKSSHKGQVLAVHSENEEMKKELEKLRKQLEEKTSTEV